jgi:Patatin-like phospholipase
MHRSIGVALSGGGHRAALFGLGPLLYLVDAGKNASVRSIASVSGGSLTNGWVAQTGRYDRLTVDDVVTKLRPFFLQLTTSGTLWAPLFTKVYLLLMIIVPFALIPIAMIPWHWSIRLFIFVLALTFWYLLFPAQRGKVCARAFRQTLFHRNGRATLLAEIENTINHVFCATDLHAGEHVYFSGDFVYAYRFGLGKPGRVPLALAVQASAAFPGAFPPVHLRTEALQMRGGQDVRLMALIDGGVYDNMGEQWAIGLANRKNRASTAPFHDIQELIVVNAAATRSWRSLRNIRIPLLGELFALIEVVNVLYDNTTSPRRTSLVTQFDQAATTGIGITGALVTIDQTPYTLARFFAGGSNPGRAQRAQAVLAALAEHDEAQWQVLVNRNKAAKTTLRKFQRMQSLELVYHAYVVACTNLHIVLEYPLLPLPTLQQFEQRL